VELVLANHDTPSASLAQTLADPTSSMRASPNKATFAIGCNPPDSPPATESEPSTSGTNSVTGRSIPPRYVQLPRRESFSTDVREPGPDTTPQSQLSVLDKPIEVLVVDDDSLTRTLMSRMLSRMGCRVSLAENGEVALEMILRGPTPSTDESHRELSVHREEQEHKYSVVFLDNQMPVMSGLKAVAKLREMGRKDFVVGVTGNALLSDQQEYLDAGVD
jgi:osomolarity two-component system, sensor histidine kinase SLN1